MKFFLIAMALALMVNEVRLFFVSVNAKFKYFKAFEIELFCCAHQTFTSKKII